ncbi:MAG: hypothetical protein ACLQQ4_08930 [Bacteroidia bacterium]
MNFNGSFIPPTPPTTDIRPVTTAALNFASVPYVQLLNDSHSYMDQKFANDHLIHPNSITGPAYVLGTRINTFGVTAQIRRGGTVAKVNFTVFRDLRKLIGEPIALGMNCTTALNLQSYQNIVNLSSLPTQVNGNLGKIIGEKEKHPGFANLQWYCQAIQIGNDAGGQNNLVAFKVDSPVLFGLKKKLIEEHGFIDDMPDISDPTMFNGLTIYTKDL